MGTMTTNKFFIYNYFNDFCKKYCVTALVWSMNFIGGLKQFFAIANHTLTWHNIYPFCTEISLFAFLMSV